MPSPGAATSPVLPGAGLWAAWRRACARLRSAFSPAPVGSPVSPCPVGPPVSPSPVRPPDKPVSQKAMARLNAAEDAIKYAKGILDKGAGNQITALRDTNFNSFFRTQVVRQNNNFDIPPKVAAIALLNPTAAAAFEAAKAELAQGGNCGEHARIVYDFLRFHLPPDEHIQIAQKEGFDHAFVIIGDPADPNEADNELVVADAWPTGPRDPPTTPETPPTNPTPVLWEDHFAYTNDRSKILNHASSKGDHRDYKREMINKGLSLNAEGQSASMQSMTPDQTDATIQAELQRTGHGWMWNHRNTAKKDREYKYVLAAS